MSRELLARLTAKTTQLTRTSSSTVKQENLSYLLSGLRRGPLYLCLWRDLGEEGARRFLWAELHNVLPRMPSIKRWHTGETAFLVLDKLIQLAIHEIGSNALCKSCNGIRQLTIGTKVRICPSCMGLGFRGMTDEDRAMWSNIPFTTWRKNWRTRYQDVYRVVLIFDERIRRNVAMRLGKRESE